MGFFERVLSAVAWLEIAVSPVLIGGMAGVFLGLKLGGALGVIAGGLFVASGLLAGIVLAEKARRETGTINFMSRLREQSESNQTHNLMTVAELNNLPATARATALATCCGAPAWVAALNQQFPFATAVALFAAAEQVWYGLAEADWREAFAHHPKIGDVKSLKSKFASTAAWAAGEQGAVQGAPEATLGALAAGNVAYEQRFGYIFIVCATGKSAEEMLARLQARLPNAPAKEIRIAGSEQAKITRLRLEKLLAA